MTAWRVRMSALANRDFADIVRWTRIRFGPEQAGTYRETLWAAIDSLTNGPDVPGARRRDEIAPGCFALHVARGGRRGRHLVLYRVAALPGPPTIEIMRLLHDAMDLQRHVPSSDTQ